MNILIVDDDHAHAHIIKHHFVNSSRQVSVHIAGSLKAGRDIISRIKPDIALIDLNLPDGKAIDELNRYQQQPPFPILVMTAEGSEEQAVAAIKAGAVDYVVKSAEAFAAMPRTVDQVLREWDARRQHLEALIALKESEQRFRTLLQDTRHIAVQGFTTDGIIHYWNQASSDLYGLREEDVLGTSLFDWIDTPEIKQDISTIIKQLISTRAAIPPRESVRRRRDGSRFHVYSSFSLVAQPGKEDQIFAFDIDITQRKQQEEQTRRAQREWETTFDAMTDMVSIHDSDMRIVRANKATFDFLGVSPEDVIGSYCYQALWGEADLCRGCPWHETVEDNETHTRTFYISQRNCHVQMTTAPFPHQFDDQQYYIHIVRDISKRRRAELELRKLSQAVEQSPTVVMITNLDAVIEYVNPKFSEVTGYSAAEAIGRNPRFLQSGEVPASTYKDLWQTLLAGEEWQGELVNRRKDGRRYWERLLISPLRNDLGEITHYIGVNEDITSNKEYEKKLEYQATHDDLTGLANQLLLKDRLEQSILHAQRSQRIVAVLLLDIDRFKLINDSLGHAVGDILLCQVATRLSATVRSSDTVARFSGDEFVVVLTEVADLDVVRKVAQELLKALERPYQVGNRQIVLTASMGISLYPEDGNDSTLLLQNADTAMYQSKQLTDSFSFYHTEMNRHLIETLDLEHDLRHALEREEFEVHYQPKVDTYSGAITGCEALLRWHHPERGLVAPDQFIPIAEETGLIVAIGRWVLEQACLQNLQWQQEGLPRIGVAVNLSARQFQQGDIVDTVRRVLDKTGLSANFLELEITESMVMNDPLGAVKILNSLKEIGVALSLDDFGTGYSSLNYLRRFPVDSLKIDRSFISDVTTDPSGASVVTSIIDIAHNLHLKAIAEGVENSAQLDFLIACQCDTIQGYYFSKPLPAIAFADLLRSGKKLY